MTEGHFDQIKTKSKRKTKCLLLFIHISIFLIILRSSLLQMYYFSVGVKSKQFIFDVYLLMVNNKHFLF